MNPVSPDLDRVAALTEFVSNRALTWAHFTDDDGTRWRRVVTLFVPGLPQPGGSKRGFFIAKINRVVITDANKMARSWKDTVATFAADEWRGRKLLDKTLMVECRFTMPRPKSHYRTGKRANELRPDAPQFHTSKPDASKLFRSTEDALTNVLWNDDSQIADQHLRKEYGTNPGARITVYVLDSEAEAESPAEDGSFF